MEAPIETKLDTILAHFDELDQKLAEAGTRCFAGAGI
jgi:hypothetical protein